MHRITREGDEQVCSCGLRWDLKELDPHSFVAVKFTFVTGDKNALKLGSEDRRYQIYVDPGHPDGDRSVVNGHVLYKDSYFTDEEIERGNDLANAVVEAGLNVCMKCGEYESGLNEPCKKGL